MDWCARYESVLIVCCDGTILIHRRGKQIRVDIVLLHFSAEISRESHSSWSSKSCGIIGNVENEERKRHGGFVEYGATELCVCVFKFVAQWSARIRV